MAFDADSQAALAALIDYAKKAGADGSEASYAGREAISAEVRMGQLEGMEREEGRSVALRAFIGKRQAAASTTDLSAKGLQALAERTVAMAKAAPEDKFCGLLDERYHARDRHPELEQSDTARPNPQQLLELAQRCEAASLAIPGIANSGGGGASSEVSHFVYMTSNGFEGADSSTSYSLGTQPVAEKDDEMERDYEWRTKRFFADLPAAEEIGRIAGERTARRLGARKVASQKAAVIFENRLAGRVLSPLLGGISGAAVARGVSFLKDKLGQRVLPEGFRIHEDPFVKRAMGSHWFDGEGGAVKAMTLVDDGVITTWLLNSSAARQLNLEPNGHASAGHGGPPGISTSNLFIKPGTEDLAGLMRGAGKGLFVTDMFSPSLNMNTGDWSVGVAGYWFENGQIQHPVSEVTVAGNLLEFYPRLRCGSDLDNRGSLEIPSLIVDDLAIGGVYDLALLEAAAREAGALARDLSAKKLEVHSKGALGPVTNVDYAVNELLTEQLLNARPDYGWLSEETPDDLERRIGKARTFMLDPIDGTAAMIGKSPQWTISIGIVEGERAFAGAIYNPMTDELFLGADGVPATLNGRRMRASLRDTLEGARIIGQPNRFAAKKWPTPWPQMEIIERQSIAYRMALVAAGQGDATLLFGLKNEWDIAAGAAIVEAAGGRVTDLWGEALRLNQLDPRAPGVAASGAPLHPLIIERTKSVPDPRKAEGR